ncbi:hypothetical protein C8R43DRAFT_187515 [Mycena crocata]|nr:hypothetical protein C8R43DRAFT_187515 [Mycena crocata]
MAVPATYSTTDLSGKFTLNRSLSDYDSLESSMEQQGVGYLKRKAVGLLSATTILKHYKDAAGVEHVDIEQQVTAGPSPKPESRVLDWVEQSIDSPLFGPIAAKTRRVTLAELDDDFLKNGWVAEIADTGLIQSHTTSTGDIKWSATQTWGIEEVSGDKRHVRHLKFTGPKGDAITIRLVYDYVGPL